MGAIKTGWDFFQDQILGMHWLKDLIGNLLVKAGMGESRFPGEFLHFFIYDVIKIFVLLAVLIFLISYIQSYFPPERSKKIMGRFHGIWANIIGALLGTVTPFCSCSSISERAAPAHPVSYERNRVNEKRKASQKRKRKKLCCLFTAF